MRRWWLLLVMGVGVLIATITIPTARVEAHAVIERSVPAVGSELPTAPPQIEMWFTEPIEPDFSGARLLDSNGGEVATDATFTDPNDPYRLTLPLSTLAPGVYTVAWHNLSSADGHQWQGAFPFTVLNADGTRPDGSPANLDNMPTDGTLRPEWVLARWLQLIGATLLFGLPFFRLVIEREAQVLTEAQLKRYAIVGLLLSGVGITLYLATQLNALGGWQRLPDFLLSSAAGRLVYIRFLLLLVLIVTLLGQMAQERSRYRVALVASAGLWLTYSLSSHAAAAPEGSVWAIAIDVLHALGAAVWVGGLWCLPLVLGSWRTNPSAKDQKARLGVIRRFSTTAFVMVVLLAVTGVFSTLVHVPDLNALLDTRYGQTLLAKLGITLVALLLAWRNRDVLHRKIGELYQPAGHRRYGLQLLVEGTVVLLLLGSVAMLVQTNLPPAASEEATYVESIIPADDLQVHLQVSPNEVGFNRFLVHLYHEDSSPIGEVQLVRLIFKYQGEELGTTTVDMSPVNSSIYQLEGSYYSQLGDWLLSVYVRRRGMDDVIVDVPFQVAGATSASTWWGNPIPTLPALVVIGGVLLVVGAGLWIARRTPVLERWQRGVTYMSGVLVLVGFGIGFAGHWVDVTGSQSMEPADTLESIAQGGALYAANCMACHGENGLGDGNVAASLTVSPANLIEHVPAHTNRGLYQFIQYGFPDSGMPPFGETLSDEEMWAVVHYIRAEFGQGIAPPQ